MIRIESSSLRAPSISDLISQRFSPLEILSAGTLSPSRKRTYFLDDVPKQLEKGSLDSSDWATYFRVYRTGDCGVAVQFWRAYAHNTGSAIYGDHGGDWEAVTLFFPNSDLDALKEPTSISMTSHSSILRLRAGSAEWRKLQFVGSHPRFYVESGGHGALVEAKGGGIVHQSWRPGEPSVTWPPGTRYHPPGTDPSKGQHLKDPGTYGPYPLPVQTPVTPQMYKGGSCEVTIQPVGHDHWITNFVILSHFTDGTIVHSQSGTVGLDQNQNTLRFGL